MISNVNNFTVYENNFTVYLKHHKSFTDNLTKQN